MQLTFAAKSQPRRVKQCWGEIVRLDKLGDQCDDCGQKIHDGNHQGDAHFMHKGSGHEKARARRAIKKAAEERLWLGRGAIRPVYEAYSITMQNGKWKGVHV